MVVYKTSVIRHDELVEEFFSHELSRAVDVAESVVELNDIVTISTVIKSLDGYIDTDEPLVMWYKIVTVPKHLKYAY